MLNFYIKLIIMLLTKKICSRRSYNSVRILCYVYFYIIHYYAQIIIIIDRLNNVKGKIKKSNFHDSVSFVCINIFKRQLEYIIKKLYRVVMFFEDG